MLSDIKISFFHLPAMTIVMSDDRDGSVAHEVLVEKVEENVWLWVISQDHATKKHGVSLAVADNQNCLPVELLE